MSFSELMRRESETASRRMLLHGHPGTRQYIDQAKEFPVEITEDEKPSLLEADPESQVVHHERFDGMS